MASLGGKEAKSSDQGVYVGEETLPPVPTKLVNRIWSWEYVEMTELQPEFWNEQTRKGPGKTHRKRPVTDLNMWLQCHCGSDGSKTSGSCTGVDVVYGVHHSGK